MNELEKHLEYFPERISYALKRFSSWDSICEIRVRCDLPLSLTGYEGNCFINERGERSLLPQAIITPAKEIRQLVANFCQGDVYRYFDTLKDGFIMDEDGFRLGICPAKGHIETCLPEQFEGANLRIPRQIPHAADEFLKHFSQRPLASTLILSKPGAGKTTLLRALAVALSAGNKKRNALRVAVIDEREEIFPSVFRSGAGLCDILSGYPKAKGIEIATRIFSPEVIVCDEIGSDEEASALLSCGNGGCLIFASVHGQSIDQIRSRPAFSKLLNAKLFQKAAILERIPAKHFQSRLYFEDLK